MRSSTNWFRQLVDLGVSRRDVLRGVTALGVAAAVGSREALAEMAAASPSDVSIEGFTAAGKSQGVTRLGKVKKTDDEWKKQLSGEQFVVTRHAGTEQAFTGSTWNLHADGLFRCICCATALYDSKTKFESGTGWPSFWQPISKYNIVEGADHTFGMDRTAVTCRRCDAHLGHVFNDGPKPTGLRYCMNSASMKFVARGA